MIVELELLKEQGVFQQELLETQMEEMLEVTKKLVLFVRNTKE